MDNLTIGLVVFIVLLLVGLAVVLYLWLSKKCEEKKCDLDLTKCRTAFPGPTGCNILNAGNCGPYHSLDQCRAAFPGPTGCPNLSDIKLYSNVKYTFKPDQPMTDICADTKEDEITVYGRVYTISGTGPTATAKIIPDYYIVSGPTTREDPNGGRCKNINGTRDGKWFSSRYVDLSDDKLPDNDSKATRIRWLNKYWGDENSPPTYGQLSKLENVPISDLKPWNYPN